MSDTIAFHLILFWAAFLAAAQVTSFSFNSAIRVRLHDKLTHYAFFTSVISPYLRIHITHEDDVSFGYLVHHRQQLFVELVFSSAVFVGA